MSGGAAARWRGHRANGLRLEPRSRESRSLAGLISLPRMVRAQDARLEWRRRCAVNGSGAGATGRGTGLACTCAGFEVGGELVEGARRAQPHHTVALRSRAAARGTLAREVGHGAERRRVHNRIIAMTVFGRQPIAVARAVCDGEWRMREGERARPCAARGGTAGHQRRVGSKRVSRRNGSRATSSRSEDHEHW